ncbi:hypothetical protein G3569_10090 [Aliifodinibius halophilus]|uniref:Uncharacterized protein n=2 Tax=Fodinibius halophilus TaxID=1736908 RepID=A0A6M1SZL0_9BACT|nr:hypothetical protein [Fodinibius halophilus]
MTFYSSSAGPPINGWLKAKGEGIYLILLFENEENGGAAYIVSLPKITQENSFKFYANLLGESLWQAWSDRANNLLPSTKPNMKKQF